MKEKQEVPATVSERALEMIMRDVLDELSDISLAAAYRETCAEFEILDIRPAHAAPTSREASDAKKKSTGAEVIHFPRLRTAMG